MKSFPIKPYPYLTAEIPGCGGNIKESPEDFMVTEIPAYEPCGSGEHLYLTIEKRGITTLEAIRRIARELHIPERDIGYAGMKDSVGVTCQTISLPRIQPKDILRRELEKIRIVSAVRHTNKLKLGHLKGNRFRIVIRELMTASEENIHAVLALLSKRGVPNYFGTQRYGAQGNSHLIGSAMLQRDWQKAVDLLIGEVEAVRDKEWQTAINAYQQGDIAAALQLMPHHCRTEREVLQRLVSRPDGYEKAFNAVNPKLKKLYLSAFQSYLFDQVVEQRLTGLDRLLPGDLAWKHVNGACFLVEDAALEAKRATDFEISPTGPMFGCKMKLPCGEPLAMEQQVFSVTGKKLEDFDLGSGLRMEGERRPLRVPLDDSRYSFEQDRLVLEFSLPKGSYATSVVREITKTF